MAILLSLYSSSKDSMKKSFLGLIECTWHENSHFVTFEANHIA